ncbi:TonB-dependent receptor [Flavobacteriaceae bacterium XHP0103]|uniref:SusC/RagA family TonB-linked outer membrane protein n=1 Tax=Marixanthotalea marina TaxID=2844359 RepID=UPI002989E5C2|nr:TonB-dependent receptor [Marixanthotalea marina]MBU3821397.1 TonB-dependent receptor [Marixanthotalea marina]
MQNVKLFCSRRDRPWFLRAVCSLTLFVAMAFAANAQTTVSGTVLDEAGVPMLGVNVIEKGTNNGTNTDFDGNYSLNVSGNNAVLVFSYLGFQNKEVSVAGQSNINVTLAQDVSALSEVVVIGYGTQRKESVTGSVVSVKGEDLAEVQTANFQQALQGRAAGVDISTTGTRPGGGNTQIRIRGTRSLSADNNPLIVLNGIPFFGGLNDINMNDIESLDILKDASATAIYGSRGANGVILITTKSGKKGQKARFSYNTYYATKEVFAKFPMMNAAQFTALREATRLYNNGNILFPPKPEDEDPGTDTDWQDLIYGTGLQTTHDLSVTGGGDDMTYNVGVGYFKETSVVPVENFQRYSFRAQLEQQIGAFKFGINSVMNYNITRGGGPGVPLDYSPVLNPYNPDGSFKTFVRGSADDFFVRTRETIKEVGYGSYNLQKDFGTYNNIFGEVAIPWVEGLKYRVNVGLNLRMSRDGNFNGRGVYSIDPNNPSNASVSSGLTTDYVIENLLTYDRTFADKHKVNFVGLFSAQEGRWDGTNLNVRNLPNEQFLFYNLGTVLLEDITGYGGNYGAAGLMSYMGRAMYQYDNRYLITATLRADGSSRLAKGNEWVTYPAVSVGWNIGNEAFMDNADFVDLLKLRVGYGETSNQAIGTYSTLGRLGTRDYNFGSTFQTGYYVTGLPNPELGWEFSETYNYGLDFGLFNNRLSGSVEYYITKTNDILYNLPLPATSGVGSYTANIGKTENKGLEVALNATIIDNPDGFTWDFGLNVYTNRNKITALASGQDRNEGALWFVGSPIQVIYDYKKVGLWNESDPDYQYIDQYEPNGGANLGSIKVQYTGDYNPDGSPTRAIGPDDRQIIDPTPDFQGGFNTRLAYKNLDLSIVGAFKSGGILISNLYNAQGYLNMLSGRRNNVNVDYWTPTNTGAKYPAPGGVGGDNPKYGETLGYFDGSYLKVRAMTLGYNFNQDFIRDAGISRLRVYATVQNPFVLFSPFHKESGMDPETNSLGGQNSATGTGGRYSGGLATVGATVPTTRNYMIGLNLTF